MKYIKERHKQNLILGVIILFIYGIACTFKYLYDFFSFLFGN
jgi:hypothetical protein